MTQDVLPACISKHRRRYKVTKRLRGERIQRTFATLDEAIAFLEQLDRRVAAVARTDPAEVTLSRVLDEWFETHKHKLTEGVQRDYSYRVAAIKKALGDHDVRVLAVDRRPLEQWLATLPVPSRRKTHTVLVQALEHAVWCRQIGVNPIRGMRFPKHRKKPLHIPTPAEVALICSTADAADPLWGLFVRLAASLGTRRGETCALRWEDFDFDDGTILVARTVVRIKGGKDSKVPKSGEVRLLRIRDASFWDTLAEFRRPAGYLFEGVHNGSRRPNPDACWYPDVPARRFARMVDQLGLVSAYGTPYRLHGLRHYVATRLYHATKDWVQVARFMGHLTPAMAIELYANHVLNEEQARLGDVAAALFRSVTVVTEADALAFATQAPGRRQGLSPLPPV